MFRRLFHTFRHEKKLLTIVGLFSVLSAGTEALALISIAPLVQAAAQGDTEYQWTLGPWSFDFTITELAAFSAAMLITALIVQIGTGYVSNRLTTGYFLRTRLEVVRAFQGSDWNVQAQEREGWLRTLSTDNVDAAQNALQALINWLKGLLGTLVFLGGALIVNFVATVVIVVVLGLVLAGLIPLNRYLRRVGATAAALNVKSSEELAGLTMNARELKIYGVVSDASQRYRMLAQEQRTVNIRLGFVEGLGTPLFKTAASLLIVAMIAWTAAQDGGQVAAVGVVAVLLYRSSNYATVLVAGLQRLARMAPTMEQLEEGLAKLWNNQVTPGDRELTTFGTLQAADVSFSYPGQATPAVSQISLKVTTSEVVGVIGPSGGGKSTLAELLIGLRRPSDGTVIIDGVRLSDLTEHSLAKCVSLVSQNVPVIAGTLRENIRFFRDIDDVDIDAAIEAAGLADVVAGLSDGLETRVGPGARALSGGQAQRLGIARALAGRPAIVVLDEPTSALDAAAEQIVTDTIGALRGLVGVVVIAHRLTTLRHCDRIIVIESGRVADEGTMDELRQRNKFLDHAIEVGRLE